MNHTRVDAGARRVRAMLLVLLVPLVVAVVWQSIAFAPKYVTDLAFSVDGRELLIGRTKAGDRNQTAWQDLAIEGTGFIETVDVSSGRLIRSESVGIGRAAFTLGVQGLVDFSRAGCVRILDRKTSEPLRQWDLPRRFGSILDVASNGQLAIVSSRTEDNTHYITCLNADGAQTLAKADFGQSQFSGDGTRLFVSYFRQRKNTWATDVYHVDGASLKKDDKLSFDGIALFTDEAGSIIIRLDALAYSVLDLRTNTSRTLTLPTAWGRLMTTFFTDDGTFFHALFARGPLVTYEVESWSIQAEVSLSPLPRFFDNHVVSNDRQSLAGIADGWRVGVWDLSSGAVLGQFPNNRPGLVWFVACLFSSGLWCLAWAICGGYLERRRPWLDALLVNGLLIAVLTVHVATRPLQDVQNWMIAAYLAPLTSLSAVFCLWSLYGPQRWSLRLAGWLVGMAVVVAALVGSGHQQVPLIWGFLLGAVFYVVGLLLLFGWWRYRGYIMSDTGCEVTNCRQSDSAVWQIPLIDMLVVTAAVAVCLSAIRFVEPFSVKVFLDAQGPHLGFALAATATVAIWTAFGRRTLLVRLIVLGLTAWSMAVFPIIVSTFLRSGLAGGSWSGILSAYDPFLGALFAGSALAVLLTFLIFRLNGYVLLRSDSQIPSANPAE